MQIEDEWWSRRDEEKVTRNENNSLQRFSLTSVKPCLRRALSM